MLEIAGVMKSFVRKNKTLFHIVIEKRHIAYDMNPKRLLERLIVSLRGKKGSLSQ